jgi:transmembrane sensor
MSNINTFCSKESIDQQACLWVSRIDRGLSDAEKTEMCLWVKAAEHHQSSLFEMAALWDDLSVLNELSGIFPLTKEQEHKNARLNLNKYRLIAASLLVFGLSVMTWFNSQDSFSNVDKLVQTVNRAETKIGEQKNLTLADGSVIHLNTNSLVKIDFTKEQRNLTLLRGEAHFEVAHDESRPFIVTAGHNQVTAVGTAFNVQFKDRGELELLVTEGKVLLANVADNVQQVEPSAPSRSPLEGKGLLVIKGEKVIFSDDYTQAKATLSSTQVEQDLAWQQGMLVFQGEDLETALKEVSRYSAVHFEIIDTSVKKQRVAGYFKAGDIDGLLFTLAQNFNIQAKRTDNNIVLSANEKS